MRRIWGCFLLVILICVFTACNDKQQQVVKFNQYDGSTLTIGVIGDAPKVKEKQVRFVKIQFSDIEKEGFDSRFDGVFITKDNLSEAAQGKYAAIYKKSKIPFFFIQSKKSYVPFIQEDLSYEDVPDMADQTYATGIIVNGDNLKYWGIGLYNDIENEENIKGAYSQIFDIISKNKISK